MARPLNSFLTDFIAAPSGETQTTVQFNLADSRVLRYATDIISFSGNSYSDNLIASEDIEETEDSGTDRTEITIQNTDKAIGLEIMAGNLNFAEASLGRFFRTKDGTNEWREIFFGQVIPVSFNEREARLEILDDMVAAGYCVANWPLAPACQLIFKSTECGYSGSETVCNKLLKGDCTKYARTFRNVSETFPLVENSLTPTAPSDGGIVSGGSGGWTDTGGGSGGTCFTADTLISMASGEFKRIADIQIGDDVVCFDGFGKLHSSKVIDKFEHENITEYFDLRFSFGRLEVTGEHPILDSNLNFRPARYFSLDHESLFLKGNEWIKNPVRVHAEIKCDIPQTVYNIHVEKFHTYIANGIPVHNLKPLEDLER